jgi:hypothetical protein
MLALRSRTLVILPPHSKTYAVASLLRGPAWAFHWRGTILGRIVADTLLHNFAA